mgnify:CR=1 FL=1
MHGTSFRQTNIYLNKKDKSRQPPVVEAVAVSYTHLTLPTICSV